MAKIIFIDPRGGAREIEVATGLSVMTGAVMAGVPGIDADCGGACACATCHVHVDAGWLARTGERSEAEDAMLDFAGGVRANSRLACQIIVTDALDGLVVRTPARQR